MDKDRLIEEVKGLPDSMLVATFEAVQKLRLAKDKEAAEVKDRENIYKAELIARMLEAKTGAMASEKHLAKLHTKETPTPKDWGLIHQYIVQHDAWELVQKRLTVSAVEERWQSGEVIPGIEKFPVYSVSISKL